MGMALKRAFVLTVVLFLVASTLHGCGGCDTEKGNACGATYTTDSTKVDTSSKETCKSTYGKAIDTYTTCLDDAGCADDEDLKKALDAAKTSVTSTCDLLRRGATARAHASAVRASRP